MDIIWSIPNPERIMDRMEELQESISNFPDSPLLNCWKNELHKLQEIPL